LHEVNVYVLNGTENVDFTVEGENRNRRTEKEKEPFKMTGKK
jgi:hypothetical protein